MTMSDEKGGMGPPQACLAHDYETMKPVVLATWKHGFQGACPDKSAILTESQVNYLFFHISISKKHETYCFCHPGNLYFFIPSDINFRCSFFLSRIYNI